MSHPAVRAAACEGFSARSSASAIAAELAHEVHSRIAAHGDRAGALRGYQLLGEGIPEITRALTRLEPLAKRSVWGMQPTMRFNPDDSSHELDRRSARRGLSMQQLVSAHGLTVNPLLPSIDPHIRVAPVTIACILIDDVAAVLPGPLDARGRPTAWLITDAAVVALGRAAWDSAWTASTPAQCRTSEPLTRRQIEVAKGLIRGVKDTPWPVNWTFLREPWRPRSAIFWSIWVRGAALRRSSFWAAVRLSLVAQLYARATAAERESHWPGQRSDGCDDRAPVHTSDCTPQQQYCGNSQRLRSLASVEESRRYLRHRKPVPEQGSV